MWIGGPEHGRVISVPDGGEIVSMQDRELMRAAWELANPALMYPADIALNTITARIHRIKLAPGKAIAWLHHPEIKEETARHFMADLVLGAWEKRLATTRYR